MKKFDTISLEHDVAREYCLLSYGVTRRERSEFTLPLDDSIARISAMRFDEDLWEHIMVDCMFLQRCATYKEMSFIKDIFWPEHELALQVHPAQSEYINHNPYALHLWRDRLITPRVEKRLTEKIHEVSKIALKYYKNIKDDFILPGVAEKLVVIFGGDAWPTWEEVCEIKQKYWAPEEVAVQFNISYNHDINNEHMILLWDAANLHLPPKELV